jgi:bacterioferritin
MGTKGRDIIKGDIGQIIELLNKAFCDEWLAYYQYWIGAQIVKGPMKEAAIAELTEHAADELRHAEMLSLRILQLGGTPVIKPEEWYKYTNCGYDAPSDPFVRKIVEQNIKGEQCAITVYNKLAEITRDRDIITYNTAISILQDEVEHEEDLQALLEDFEDMLKYKS